MNKDCILVTGSNGGIGQYVVESLLKREKRNIICHFRSSSSKIEAVLKKFDLPLSEHLVQADLCDEKSVQNMKQQIEKNGSNINSLVNVAGASSNGMSWKLEVDDFKKILDDNLLSTFITCKTFIPKMREQGFGRIINFSSIVAFTGVAGASHYCAAKAGINGFTKAIALELANKSITCNTIALGYFDAGLIHDVPAQIQEDLKKKIPLARFGSSNDVGSMTNFLLSRDADFMTGQVFHINGGQY